MQILCLVNSRRELHSEILQKKTCDIKPAVQLVMQITCKDLHWVANYQVITETNFTLHKCILFDFVAVGDLTVGEK